MVETTGAEVRRVVTATELFDAMAHQVPELLADLVVRLHQHGVLTGVEPTHGLHLHELDLRILLVFLRRGEVLAIGGGDERRVAFVTAVDGVAGQVGGFAQSSAFLVEHAGDFVEVAVLLLAEAHDFVVLRIVLARETSAALGDAVCFFILALQCRRAVCWV